jgi:hypothetical protein
MRVLFSSPLIGGSFIAVHLVAMDWLSSAVALLVLAK